MKINQLVDAISNIDEKYIVEAQKEKGVDIKMKKSKKMNMIKYAAIAASVLLICAVVIPNVNGGNNQANITIGTPSATSPNEMRKMFHLNGSRYEFVASGSTITIKNLELGDLLGVLENELTENNYNDDLVTTFAVGGKIFELEGYNSEFRVAVEWDGQLYLAQNVGTIMGEEKTLKEYFEIAELNNRIEDITIMNHFGNEKIKTLSKQERSELLEKMQMAINTTLEYSEYEELAQAQGQGNSYKVLLNLNDSTTIECYVVPEMKLLLFGDQKYRMEMNQ